jgi:serine/threonine-protein kinase
VGTVIAGNYRLDEQVGEGGTGIVWAATRIPDGGRVAIKVLRAARHDLCLRLRGEADLAQRVEHAGIVRVFEVLELADRAQPALVMELLQGADLADFLRRTGRLSVSRVLAIMHPVVDAVLALHRHAIAHRDLKPSNIFLERRGEEEHVRVLDLGMARSLDLERRTVESTRVTYPGTVLGTPRYMAPEQLAAEEGVDGRADVWALGAVLYEMLSDVPHVEASLYEDVVRELATRSIVALERRAPHVPRVLAEAVDRALCRDPGRRPTAEELRRTITSAREACSP